jgi:hypothetical protein
MEKHRDEGDTMAKDVFARVTRVASHEVAYGKHGIVTRVTVEFGEDIEDNEDRHATVFEMYVEYAGHPRHKVGDRFPAMPEAALLAMGIV